MNHSGMLSAGQLSLFYAVLSVPLILLWQLKLQGVIRELLVGVLRMTLQLVLIGFYLEFLFKQNSLWLNLAWLLVMVTVANIHVLKKAGLSVPRLLWVGQLSLLVAVGLTLAAMLLLVQPEPWYGSRYLVPLAGMLLGNCLTGNILALERFYSSLEERHEQFMGDLLLGASLYEAVSPFLQEALRAALGPMVATLATLGIVSLPGMMTGQILGGVEPMEAVAYQIMIMLGIVSSMTVSAVLNVLLSLRVCFDGFGLLDARIFARNDPV